MIKREDNGSPISEDIRKVSLKEGVAPKHLAGAIKTGECIVISSRRGKEPVGIGKGLRAKFACIVGTSAYELGADKVIQKAKSAV